MALKFTAVVIISFSYTDEKILEILFHLDFFKENFHMRCTTLIANKTKNLGLFERNSNVNESLQPFNTRSILDCNNSLNNAH